MENSVDRATENTQGVCATQWYEVMRIPIPSRPSACLVVGMEHTKQPIEQLAKFLPFKNVTLAVELHGGIRHKARIIEHSKNSLKFFECEKLGLSFALPSDATRIFHLMDQFYVESRSLRHLT